MQQKKLLKIPIHIGSWSSVINKIFNMALNKSQSSYVCLANVHMIIEAKKHSDYCQVLHNADLIVPDGKPLTWGLKFLYGIKQPRIAGMDMLPRLLNHAETCEVPVFFYGGTEMMINKSKVYINEVYPNLKVGGYISPPFRKLTEIEENDHLKIINESGARIVFVILGCPKQEKWMAKMKGKLNVCMIGLGGALPVLIGLQKRAPIWMQNFGFEWIFRLLQEPRRLFKRYFYTNSLFIFLISKELLAKKILNKVK